MSESWGHTKPKGAMKVKCGLGPQVGRIPSLAAGALPARLVAALPVRRSKSAHVGTRKMVNYA